MTQSEMHQEAIKIAQLTKWDGKEICEIFLEALTDANFHQLRRELEKVIDKEF